MVAQATIPWWPWYGVVRTVDGWHHAVEKGGYICKFYWWIAEQAIAAALHENKTLKLLNIESNYVSGQAIVNILAGVNAHQVMTEFKVSNQVSSVDYLGRRF